MKEIRFPEFKGGLNTHDPEYLIENDQSPDMLNLWWKDKVLSKRYGQRLATTLSSCYAISSLYNGYQCVHAGTKLYKWDGTTATTVKASGVANTKGVFVEFGDDLYYNDLTELWHISSDYTVTAVTPYVPTVKINTVYDNSGGDDNESYNLIGAGFKVTYNGDGTHTTYTLPQSALDATAVTVLIDNVAKTEDTHFTVNRTAGTLDFSAGTSPHGAPGSGTNNVEITAYKTVTGSKAKVTNCKVYVPYGGETSGVNGGTRVFAMRNSTQPFAYWTCDLGIAHGMTYWPDTQEEYLDANGEAITAAAKMGNQLVVFKTNSIFAIGYSFDGTDVFYPVRECHSSIGCDVPYSVQLVDNKLAFCNTKTGVHILISTNNELENIVKPISQNIDAKLLTEPTLSAAVSADFEQRYWLCVNGRAYVWDYGLAPYYNYSDYSKAQRRLVWYLFDNINAVDFYSGDSLYYASTAGIVQFTTTKNDFGEAINSYYKSKAFDMGNPHWLKRFDSVYPSFAPDSNINVEFSVLNEDGIHKTKDYATRTFSFMFSWDTFTWARIKFAGTYALKIKMKKCKYIQIYAVSDQANYGFGLVGMSIKYDDMRPIK